MLQASGAPARASSAIRRKAYDPDTRSPARFLRWMVRQQGALVWVATALGVLWQLPLIVGPWIFGRAIASGRLL